MDNKTILITGGTGSLGKALTQSRTDLSIIIPCHNLENHIEKCLDSILQQNIVNIKCEIIFICDSCTDTTEEKIVKKMKSSKGVKWHWEVRKVNYKSPGLSRNKGMSFAKGKYIWFIDGDDWLINNNAIQVIIGLFRHDPSIDVVRFRFDSQGYPNKGVYITIWQYVFKKEFIKDIKFQGVLFNEDVAFVKEMRSRSPNIKRIYDYFYWYNFPREGSLTEQRLIKNGRKDGNTMIRAHFFASKNNFGDQLVGPIIKWLCDEDIKWVGSKVEGKLLCIGSELTRGVLRKNDVVWGYGAKQLKPITVPEGVQILSTRGKKTAALLKDNEVTVFGDPALLMPKVYEAPKRTGEYNIGIIPHHTDTRYFTKIKHRRAKVFNILDDKYKIIQDMHKCNVILSTSLHGCIVAEAYGIPVVWIRTARCIVGGFEFKWNDYFSGTGRDTQKPYQLPHPITLKDLGQAKFQVLPKPIIDTDELEKVWRDFYNSPGINNIRG